MSTKRFGQRTWEALDHIGRPLIIVALLALLFPANVFVFSYGQIDLLTSIPYGTQIWLACTYIIPGLALLLIIALALHRRAERWRLERKRRRLQKDVEAIMELVRQHTKTSER